MTYLPGRDYFVCYDVLPRKVRGLVTVNEDCTYTIVINSLLPECQRKKTYDHEVDHIENEDFYNGLPIEEIEPQLKRGA